MSSDIRLDLLWNVNDYIRLGSIPWTFFAYPTSIAVEHGLPPDVEACKLLATIQANGIQVAIWVNKTAKDTTYFACPYEARHKLHTLIEDLEFSKAIEKDFCRQHSDRLFRGTQA
jgi:hypothetical protein